jgi:hypothetical protein
MGQRGAGQCSLYLGRGLFRFLRALAAPAGVEGDFAPPTASSSPAGIAAGPDGNLWFTEADVSKIGEINPVTHAITEFATPTASSNPNGIAVGPDGNVWFSEFNAGKIGFVGADAPAASIAAPSVTGSGQQGTAQVCQGDRWSNWAWQQPLVSEYGFDGYQWLSDDSQANMYTAIPGATAQSYTPVAGDVGHNLECTVTVTYPLLQTTTSATSSPVTVLAQNSGPKGATGPAGTNGTNGANGARGATGPRGPAGEIELVKCKAVKHKKKTVQVCTTQLVSRRVKFTTSRTVRASLSRDGVLYATGAAARIHGRMRLLLTLRRRLEAGRYTLALTRRQRRGLNTSHRPITIE